MPDPDPMSRALDLDEPIAGPRLHEQQILEFSSTQNTVYLGDEFARHHGHHTIIGLASGANITKATNGMLYLPTQVGLQRVDPNTWGPAVTVTPFGGPGYGVNALPNGNIVYAADGGSTDIHIYNPTTNVDTLAYYRSGPDRRHRNQHDRPHRARRAGEQRHYPAQQLRRVYSIVPHDAIPRWPGVCHDGHSACAVQQRQQGHDHAGTTSAWDILRLRRPS